MDSLSVGEGMRVRMTGTEGDSETESGAGAREGGGEEGREHKLCSKMGDNQGQ